MGLVSQLLEPKNWSKMRYISYNPSIVRMCAASCVTHDVKH